jgi:hypothetical protein
MVELGERQYWLWVTRPDYYLDEDGSDREDLDPNSEVDSDGWWTCQKEPLAEGIRLEEELEEALVSNLRILKKFGYDLELYFDPASKQYGRQFVCKGNGGRIDLLCFDKRHTRYVVIELKNVRASQNTFGQISNYIGWVQDRISNGIPVAGLVISRGYDTKFESALKITDKISHVNVKDLGF